MGIGTTSGVLDSDTDTTITGITTENIQGVAGSNLDLGNANGDFVTVSGTGVVGLTTIIGIGQSSITVSRPITTGIGTHQFTFTKTTVGTTASATLSVVNGVLSGTANITNAGFGYTHSVPPQVITALPSVSLENITNAGVATGFSGIITGIQTATGIGGNPLALEFFVTHPSISALAANNRILVSDTVTGFGITSIDGHNSSTVGIGTTFLNNVYKVDAFSRVANAGILTCNVLSTTSVVGIATTGSATNPCGTLSFGKISGFTRSSSPISIGVTGLNIDAGLSTFPILQRRGTGLRDTGGLSK